eukprot:781243_1
MIHLLKRNRTTLGLRLEDRILVMVLSCQAIVKATGFFKRLSGIQFVPCFDTPFAVKTYQTSVYTSIQIHSCVGAGAGIEIAKSSLLSLTITGLSKSEKYISKGPYSLQSSEDWD